MDLTYQREMNIYVRGQDILLSLNDMDGAKHDVYTLSIVSTITSIDDGHASNHDSDDNTDDNDSNNGIYGHRNWIS